MEPIAELKVDPTRGRVFEHGWQSWSTTTTYRVDERPHRPANEANRILHYRPESHPTEEAFHGEGLLAVDPGDGGPITVFAAPDARTAVPSVRAEPRGDRLIVSADGPVEHHEDDGPGGLDGALARWADADAQRAGVGELRPAPTVWCSWYHYFTHVTEADMDENLAALDDLDLPVDVVQLDDGYQTEIGDWLSLSDRFASLEGMVDRIRKRGRRTGIWVAPFYAGARSELAARHPEWLVQGDNGPVVTGHNWDQDLYALDTTHPGVEEHLTHVFATMRDWGIDYFKIDFIYTAAFPGHRREEADPLAAYRRGVQTVRRAIGDAYLLGCGAPILPSVGLFDAMRVSPDTAPHYEPETGELAKPGSRAAMLTGRARAFQHGRFWANDPDCLIVRPEVERREEWADHVARYGGLRASSDRLADLDDWGLETTRRLLSQAPPAVFVPSA